MLASPNWLRRSGRCHYGVTGLVLLFVACGENKSGREPAGDASTSPDISDANAEPQGPSSVAPATSEAPDASDLDPTIVQSDTSDSDSTGASSASDSDSTGASSASDPDSTGAQFDASVETSDGDVVDASTDAPPGNAPRIAGCQVFPQDNPWNTDVSLHPVHPNSDGYVDSVGRETTLHPDFGTQWEGAPIGIPYIVVNSSQPSVPITYTAYGSESDPGPMPIPLNAPIEGGPNGDGDRHTLVIDETTCTLFELYRAFPTAAGFEAESGTVWDLQVNEHHPEGCTSADAAGLPIFPGLVRYAEVVEQGEVNHALRFTVSRSQRAYVFPARHYASDNTDPSLPPMGLRFRMKASYDCATYSPEVQVLCRAMKRYGLIVADNGSNWYISGAPDERWSDDNLRDLKRIPGDAFEVVDTGTPIVTDAPECEL